MKIRDFLFGAELDLDTRKDIQFSMLKEIDSFCRQHSIRYSLAYGTLLGAIRHNGFIPWDDDVDIMMPIVDLLVFKKIFSSSTIKFCDIDTEPHYGFDFPRLADVRTYSRSGLCCKSYGVSIDLYPMIPIPSDDLEQKLFFEKAEALENRRKRLRRIRSKVIRLFPLNNIPFHDKAVSDIYQYWIKNSGLQSGVYYIVEAPLSMRETDIFTFDLFKQMVEVVFEGEKFMAISDYDYYLKQVYGDYMTPPPLEERAPYHGGHFYWKSNSKPYSSCNE